MRRACVLVLFAGCWSRVTPAPPGTPPLVIKIPYSVTTTVLPVSVRWEATCEETWTSVSFGSREDEERLDIGLERQTSNVSCKKQRFHARATCVPGPCTVIHGNEGKSRTLSVAFGKPGKHALTLTIDNGDIAKSWTTDVELVVPDALRIGCSVREGDAYVPCAGRSLRAGATFKLTADAFAGGQRVDVQPDLETKGPFVQLDDGHWQAPVAGTYFVHASHDGLVADLAIQVSP